MKILVVSNYRGINVARSEAEIFIALHKQGHDITIMTYPDADYVSIFEAYDLRVIGHHPQKKNDPAFRKVLREELSKNNYDILHLFNNKAIRNGVKAAKGIDVKVISYRSAAANMSIYNPINYLKFYHPRIDFTICNSEEIRQQFLKSPFVSKNNPITILKGHDINWYKLDDYRRDIRKEYDIPEGTPIFVTIANNRKVKGISVLLRAIQSIPQKIPFAHLIIGKGMESFQKEYSNHPKVHFLGYQRDAFTILDQCDIYVCPSTASESLTKSVIEAMCFGVIPIISDLPGNVPLVDHLENGLIFENKNSDELAEFMILLCQDIPLRNRLQQKTVDKIKKDLNIQNTIEAYDTLYRFIEKSN